MFILHETSTNLGKLSMDVNSIPGFIPNKPLFRAFTYIWSPCTKMLSIVDCDHSNNGIRLAVEIADKLIKAHCLPLDSVLKHSAP